MVAGLWLGGCRGLMTYTIRGEGRDGLQGVGGAKVGVAFGVAVALAGWERYVAGCGLHVRSRLFPSTG